MPGYLHLIPWILRFPEPKEPTGVPEADKNIPSDRGLSVGSVPEDRSFLWEGIMLFNKNGL